MTATTTTTFRLPKALLAAHGNTAVDYLNTYYGRTGKPYLGSTFDTWDTTDTRQADMNRFTPDDVLAVVCLSVTVPPAATWVLLRDRADELADLLTLVGPDRDLADVDEPIDESWPAWQLHTALTSIPGIKRTIGGKLLARKRPRLLPIYDKYVAQVTGCEADHWEPLWQALRADGRALHRRLLRLRDEARLPAEVSALRVFDVICWMEGRRSDTSPASPTDA